MNEHSALDKTVRPAGVAAWVGRAHAIAGNDAGPGATAAAAAGVVGYGRRRRRRPVGQHLHNRVDQRRERAQECPRGPRGVKERHPPRYHHPPAARGDDGV